MSDTSVVIFIAVIWLAVLALLADEITARRRGRVTLLTRPRLPGSARDRRAGR